MSSQSLFPGSGDWGVRRWMSPPSEQPAKPIDVGGNFLKGVDWQEPSLHMEPDEAAKKDYLARKYDRYMCSPEWRRNRQPALDRAGGRCEQCHKYFASLEVHHLTYERFRRERPEDLEAVCHDCHPGRDKARRDALDALWEARLQELDDEWDEERDDARFEAYVRAACGGLGPNDISEEDLDELRERFERRKSEGDD